MLSDIDHRKELKSVVDSMVLKLRMGGAGLDTVYDFFLLDLSLIMSVFARFSINSKHAAVRFGINSKERTR